MLLTKVAPDERNLIPTFAPELKVSKREGFDITITQLGKKACGKYYNHYARKNWSEIEGGLKRGLGRETVTVKDLLNASVKNIVNAPGIGIRRVQILLSALETEYGYSLKKNFLKSKDKTQIDFDKIYNTNRSLREILERKT